jgi:hypothetical protein
MRIVAALAVLVACLGCARNVAVPPPSRGILLEQLSWVEAERTLTPSTVVVLALGAESKEHGPHLKLGNDFLMAEYLKRRVLSESSVVVAPPTARGSRPCTGCGRFSRSTARPRWSARWVVPSISTRGSIRSTWRSDRPFALATASPRLGCGRLDRTRPSGLRRVDLSQEAAWADLLQRLE